MVVVLCSFYEYTLIFLVLKEALPFFKYNFKPEFNPSPTLSFL